LRALLIIQLDGISAGAADGLIISGGGSTVRGLIISNFAGNGITLSGLGGNTIEANWIGVDSTGTAAAGQYCWHSRCHHQATHRWNSGRGWKSDRLQQRRGDRDRGNG
jgi:hypothetical protein